MPSVREVPGRLDSFLATGEDTAKLDLPHGVNIIKLQPAGAPGPSNQTAAISVDYLGQRLEWVMLCGEDTTRPPDFWFDDPDFQPRLPALSPAPGAALTRALEEYQRFQHGIALGHPLPLVQYEYKSTVGNPEEFGHVAIDVVCPPARAPSVPRDVTFHVRFHRISNVMPNCPFKKLVLDNPPMLVVLYKPGVDGVATEARAHLIVSPEITAAVGEIECPLFPGPSQYLGKYVLGLEEQLKIRLAGAANRLVVRRKFVASFLSHFGSALLEYDLEDFRWMHFLFLVDGYNTVVGFTLPAGFPEKAPHISLQSLYQFDQSRAEGVPRLQSFNQSGDFPYSPRWSMDEMAIRTRAWLQVEIPKFRRAEIRK